MVEEQITEGLKKESKEEKEVVITYETLFELLRREKNRDELQKLEASFFNDVVNYLKGKYNILAKSQTEIFAAEEREKTLIQIQNIKKILRELYDRREKKIINIAINKSRTRSSLIDTSSLLEGEMELYSRICDMLDCFRKNLLENVLETRMPLMPQAQQAAQASQTLMNEDNGADNNNTASAQSDQLQSQSSQNQPAAACAEAGLSTSTVCNHDDEEQEIRSSMISVKMLASLPGFTGPDLENYGPYEKDAVAKLPEIIANILAERGKAEIIQK